MKRPAIVAVIAPDGALLRSDTVALGLWEALVDGRFGLAARDDRAGRRYYLLVENLPRWRERARLTGREAEVLRLAARGVTGKGIGYALGLSPPAVSEALARAAAKAGLGSRVELVRSAAAL